MSRRALSIAACVALAASGAARGQAPAENNAEPAAPFESVQQLLALYNLDQSRLDQLVDHRPITEDETETLMRLLYAAGRFSPADWHRWQRPPDWPRLAAATAEHRGDIVLAQGRVRRVTEEKPLDELVARFDMPRYYRCEVALDGVGWPATILARTVPSDWALDAPLDERFTAPALVAKFASDAADDPRPVLVAGRMAWHRDVPSGRAGMDAGLFDDVRGGGAIRAAEREAFYQLLAATKRAGAELDREAPRPGNDAIAGLLERPREHAGELVAVEGTALRALLVRVDEPEIAERLGIDHYYTLSLSAPLPVPVQLDGQVYESFPVEVCVAELPPDMPTGERINEPVRIAGFFFKDWIYATPSAGVAKRRQIAPLLIGARPRWLGAPKALNVVNPVAAVLLAAAAVAVLGVVIWLARSADLSARQEIDRRLAPREPPSFENID